MTDRKTWRGVDMAAGSDRTSFRCLCGFACDTATEMLEHVRAAHGVRIEDRDLEGIGLRSELESSRR